jgi:hypothetical protein
MIFGHITKYHTQWVNRKGSKLERVVLVVPSAELIPKDAIKNINQIPHKWAVFGADGTRNEFDALPDGA